ncbi:hypothetical protein HQ560_13595, partial [bacterium]|nr:hypothetical protein [bacterium]
MPQRVIALSTRLRDLTVRIMRSRWFRVALGLFGWWAVALGVMLLGQARITYVLQETTHDVSGRASGLCCQGYYGLIPGIRSWVTQCILLTLGGALFISAGLWYR